MPRTGPIVIGYDGSAAAVNAVREAGELLAGREALVVVVWKEGLGFEQIEHPTASTGLRPATVNVGAALEVDQRLFEAAEHLAEGGAALATEAGFEAVGIAVADEIEVPESQTLVRIAGERDAAAIVVGAHGHGKLSEVLLGSTSTEVVRNAPCPVVVARER
jgi:nucleotide-binding universal stress UspA family protein